MLATGFLRVHLRTNNRCWPTRVVR